MQIIRQHKKCRILCRIAVFSALFVLLALALFQPQVAQANEYSVDGVSIDATVNADGSLHVKETRTFNFDGDFTCVWWILGTMPDDSALQVNGVTYQGGSIGESGYQVSPTEFDTLWRTEGGPGGNAYSIDTQKNSIYVFFDQGDTLFDITIDYTLTNYVLAYSDCGELYWQYVTSGWEVDSNDVTLNVHLPVPAGQSVVPQDNVYAWGHGTLSGNVSFEGDKSTVAYTASRVGSGQYAEARIIFPAEWLTAVPASSLGAHKDQVIAEEDALANQANQYRTFSLILVIVLCILCLAAIGVAIFLFMRYGKEHEPTFTDEYWRDVPDKDIHPTVIARLCNWNHDDNNHFTATIMHLYQVGALSINKGTYEKKGVFGQKTVEDFYLTRNAEVAEKLINPIDLYAMGFLFDSVGDGQGSIWLSQVKTFGEENPQKYTKLMETWQGQLSGQVNAAEFFEAKGPMIGGAMTAAGVCLIIGGFLVSFFFENAIIIPFAAVSGVVFLVLATKMSRRTQKGADDYARSMALKKWLTDFTALDERPPQDVKVWGEYLVYAYIFGVAEQVIDALRDTMPDLFTADDAMMASNDNFLPWYALYAAPSGTGSIGSAFGDACSTAISNASSTAQAALDAIEGGSSGFGGGGGFSMGGGGGFGGGGGGGAR